ncbi:reverse transcriptase domain-containing protein [Megasphaera elsdenii]|uniref:RNA-directed DNA polymerase (Reverse transcriptase) n=1 Tax=Megasphaera elsdenii DSM 20460 TaxID=1064535 RepID=G0VPG1_MEGEL|nr:reverse transcriptase domain-containing protein [Megasphaera elsdenii]CCC73339.1 RNA-directed DNA polymerase (Reverse transcriptase) [Megasphaera elsdenii DSM 20460]
MQFAQSLEENLIEIQNELIWREYRVGKYHEFYVRDPKRRLIMALPSRDRVVQWAIYRQLNPILDRRYLSTSYGCRIGGGAHRAVAKLKEYLRLQTGTAYILKMDVSKYFYRIDHDVLMGILERIVKDRGLLWLLHEIIYSDHDFGIATDDYDFTGERLSSVGMPIGNLSSQMFANLYLNEADQYAKRILKCKYYIRYMDDVIVVSNDRARLWEVWRAMDDFMRERLRLKLNAKTCIRSEVQGVDFCGYRIWRDHIRLRKKSALKMKHRLRWLKRAYARGEVDIQTVAASLTSYFGLLSHCDSYELRKSILNNLVLVRKRKEGNK